MDLVVSGRPFRPIRKQVTYVSGMSMTSIADSFDSREMVKSHNISFVSKCSSNPRYSVSPLVPSICHWSQHVGWGGLEAS